MPAPPDVLLVDDEESVLAASAQTLELAGLRVRAENDPSRVAGLVSRGFPGVLVTDVRMPRIDGLTLMRDVLAVDAELPVVLMTGHGDVPMAVQAIRDGAYDFIEKPCAADTFIDIVRRALEKRSLVLENRALREALDAGDTLSSRIIGRTPEMEDLRRRVEMLAASQVDVLLLGETGTGKDLVARTLHERSERAERPFVAINCGALPESIIESELFGHEAGAFTGATRARIGKFEYANGGTVLLDEIESMPLALQVRLLRVLQEREVEPLGSNKRVALDIRVIAASKIDLADAARRGVFRDDLYYRLNVAPLTLAPLRGHAADIPLLFQLFAQRAAARHRVGDPPPPPPAEALLAHDWPGNVRELQHAAERHVLGLGFSGDRDAVDKRAGGKLSERVDAFEKSLIDMALREHAGSIKAVCESLDLPRKTLYDKLAKHGLRREDYLAPR